MINSVQRGIFYSFVPVVSSVSQVPHLFLESLIYILFFSGMGEKNSTNQIEITLECIRIGTTFLLCYVDAEDRHI